MIFRCQYVWIDNAIQADIDVTTDGSGLITAIGPSATEESDEVIELHGLVLPGIANAHSHAFHRALRGRTHSEGGSFWTWRERMYQLAAVLDPDSYYRLARAVYAEMVLAGITCVGEFHYVHHQVDGTPYTNPNAMGEALRTAARDAGLRLTLLDTCYLAGGLDANGSLQLAPEQRRFSDGDAPAWAARVSLLDDDSVSRIGAAIHSVRAVPRDQIATVVEWADGRPLHVHLSEQVAENQASQLAYSMTPTELLAAEGALSPHTTAVHATHLTDRDIELLGASGTYCCFCPTTERDLADGIGPSTALLNAGSPLCLGSDQHAVIDPFEEARGLEMHERLATNQRGRLQISQLIDALTVRGHQSLGWADAGRIAVGYRADLVSVRLDSVRTAGSDPAQALLAAYAADVDTVVIDGRVVVVTGIHRDIDVELELQDVICELWALIES